MVIKTKKQHEEVLAEVSKIMDKDPEKDSEDGKRLTELADAIVIYEKIHFPSSNATFEDKVLTQLEAINGNLIDIETAVKESGNLNALTDPNGAFLVGMNELTMALKNIKS